MTGSAQLHIVPMRRDHVAALMPYEREMFGTEAWTRNSYLDELTDRSRVYLAAESPDGQLLGWAGVRVVGDESDVLTIGVVPQARRRGVGRRLLAELLDAARSRGATVALLEVRVDNDAARTLYRDEGFEEVGVRCGYYAGGRVDGVTMRREL